MKVLRGVCSKCQTEVGVSRKTGFCFEHAVCNKDGMPPCTGSTNSEPEDVWEVETDEL